MPIFYIDSGEQVSFVSVKLASESDKQWRTYVVVNQRREYIKIVVSNRVNELQVDVAIHQLIHLHTNSFNSQPSMTAHLWENDNRNCDK